MKSAPMRETILVVDDIPETVEVLQRNLSARGYVVLTAAGVAEALKVTGSVPVDLVITDYRMPKASGLDLVRCIRENLKDTEVNDDHRLPFDRRGRDGGQARGGGVSGQAFHRRGAFRCGGASLGQAARAAARPQRCERRQLHTA